MTHDIAERSLRDANERQLRNTRTPLLLSVRTKFDVNSVQLVVPSLLFPVLGLGGPLYWMLAAVLGLWLLASAWQVFRGSGNRTAWLMYRRSSIYLGLLFSLLVIDALI